MTQQSHFWAYTLRKPDLKETMFTQCSSQHYLLFTCILKQRGVKWSTLSYSRTESEWFLQHICLLIFSNFSFISKKFKGACERIFMMTSVKILFRKFQILIHLCTGIFLFVFFHLYCVFYGSWFGKCLWLYPRHSCISYYVIVAPFNPPVKCKGQLSLHVFSFSLCPADTHQEKWSAV